MAVSSSTRRGSKVRAAEEGIRVEVDGVPAHIVDRGGPFVLGLTFRVGYADEELCTSGITHMVEHLALHEAAEAEMTMNGCVSANSTTFYVRGEPDEAVEFVSSVCRSLRNLPVPRLEGEARVLRTEGNSRKPSTYSALLANRFGASGYGLDSYPELGLHRPDPSYVQQWASYWFTADNAVLWASGQLPSDLRIDLPRGHRIPPPVPASLPWTLPAWYAGSQGVVALSFLVPRCDAATVASRVLDRRLHDRLRVGQAQSYDAGTFIDPLTAEHLHGMAYADTLPDHADDVRDGLLAELGRLATVAPSDDEIDGVIAFFEKQWAADDASGGIASSSALNELIGHRVRTARAAIADIRAVRPEEITATARWMMDSAVLQVPGGVGVRDQRFTPLPPGSSSTPAGTTYVRSARLEDGSGDHTLVVGAGGVAYVHSTEERIAVGLGEVVAVQHWADGARTVWGRDGLRVFVHPDEWRNGAVAVQALDRLVGAARAVPMDQPAGSGYLEEVQQVEAAKPPKRGVFGRRKAG